MNTSSHRNTFPKAEKLKSHKLIKELFDKSSSVFLYPFKIAFLTEVALPAADEPSPSSPAAIVRPASGFPQVLISVSKRSFKRAVDRNRIKRQIREAYRLNRNRVFANATVPIPVAIGIIYVGKEKLDSAVMHEKMYGVLKRLAAGKISPEKGAEKKQTKKGK